MGKGVGIWRGEREMTLISWLLFWIFFYRRSDILGGVGISRFREFKIQSEMCNQINICFDDFLTLLNANLNDQIILHLLQFTLHQKMLTFGQFKRCLWFCYSTKGYLSKKQ